MTLKERLLSRKPLYVKEELDRIANLPESKLHAKFFDICERLQENVDLRDIRCDTYEKVFELVEKYNINVSDIILNTEYEDFKNAIIHSKSKKMPIIRQTCR